MSFYFRKLTAKSIFRKYSNNNIKTFIKNLHLVKLTFKNAKNVAYFSGGHGKGSLVKLGYEFLKIKT